MTTSPATTTATTDKAAGAATLYSALVGLTSLAIILQGAWAGMFIREGKDNNDHWVEVHDWGARVCILLALLAAVVAVARLRSRLDLVVGSVALFVLLVFESFVGGLIGNHPGTEVIHFPLALALVGLSVWLPLRSRSLRRAS